MSYRPIREMAAIILLYASKLALLASLWPKILLNYRHISEASKANLDYI